jgi:hypothetical protein
MPRALPRLSGSARRPDREDRRRAPSGKLSAGAATGTPRFAWSAQRSVLPLCEVPTCRSLSRIS